MKHNILLILGIIIFSSSITSAKLINNPSNGGDEEVKVLVLIQKKGIINIADDSGFQEQKSYFRIIKTGDKFNVKEESGKRLNGYLGKIKEDEGIVIVDKKGLIVGETQLSKIIQIEHKGSRYMVDAKGYSLEVKTRIITAKSKRKEKTLKNILGKTLWTILAIIGVTIAFRRFL